MYVGVCWKHVAAWLILAGPLALGCGPTRSGEDGPAGSESSETGDGTGSTSGEESFTTSGTDPTGWETTGSETTWDLPTTMTMSPTTAGGSTDEGGTTDDDGTTSGSDPQMPPMTAPTTMTTAGDGDVMGTTDTGW